jgi:hypothetical protein
LALPLDASCFESCPCSLAPLASNANMKFLQTLCLLPTHACPLHVDLMKVDEWVSNGACMINFN